MKFEPGSVELEAAKLVGAGIVGFMGAFLLEYGRRFVNRRERVAQFLTTIAGSLEGIASCFDKREIPYTHGHILEITIAAFGKRTGNVLGKEKARYLRSLNTIIEEAGWSDGMIDKDDAEARSERMQVSRNARRVAGDLLGEAAKLSAK